MVLSWWHIVLVLLVFLLLFGTGKISGLMADLAKGLRSFKKEMNEEGAETEPARERNVIDRRSKPAVKAKNVAPQTPKVG
jgi:sec-independent protein translocase protein TatA